MAFDQSPDRRPEGLADLRAALDHARATRDTGRADLLALIIKGFVVSPALETPLTRTRTRTR